MNIYGVGYGLRTRMSAVNQKTDQTLNKMSLTLLGGEDVQTEKRLHVALKDTWYKLNTWCFW